jgi:hypothetical protein
VRCILAVVWKESLRSATSQREGQGMNKERREREGEKGREKESKKASKKERKKKEKTRIFFSNICFEFVQIAKDS